MTSSVGVSCRVPPCPDDPHDLLERADQSLYRAKANGRDAVWYWNPSHQSPTAAAGSA